MRTAFWEKKLETEPIVLPASPFWEVLRTFGRDELIALAINTGSTAAVAVLLSNPLLISVTGPIVEKIGFFVAHFQEAGSAYLSTPKSSRKTLGSYLKTAFAHGLSSLGKDIAVHDPLYTLLMYFGLLTLPQVPAWILAVVSFMVAIAAVMVGEVAVNETRYLWLGWQLRAVGFRREPYFESRFYIKVASPKKILIDFATEFHLSLRARASYHDRYLVTNLKSYNGRKPILRLRQRNKETGGWMQTLQVVYTRASEWGKRKPRQFNYFLTKKDKFWASLPTKMPWEVDQITDKKLRNWSEKHSTRQHHDVFFTREVVRDPKTILVSVDQVTLPNRKKLTLVEIKAHTDEQSRQMLILAMRYAMLRYEAVQTTHGKSMLVLTE